MLEILFPLMLDVPVAAGVRRLEVQPAKVLALPGSLDQTPVLNSNSPELILNPGILVSTFPGAGKKNPRAHLNFLFKKGRFDIFAHHVAKYIGQDKTLYLGALVHNPGSKPATIKFIQAASFLTNPDASFRVLPTIAENPAGTVFAGPGDRMTDLILRGYTQQGWPAQIVVPPHQSRVLFSLPVPLRDKLGAQNARSLFMRLDTSEPVYAATLSTYANANPTASEWQALLNSGNLAGPRDRAPSKPKSTIRPIYGRVAGVSRGARWQAYFTDDPRGALRLTLPDPGGSTSYCLSTLEQGAFGTNQRQAAPMVVRYADTAYKVQGNYAIEYNLFLPLYNSSSQPQLVELRLQTPLKSNRPKELAFWEPPGERVWFRGTLRLRYRDDAHRQQTRYVHVVEHQGDRSESLAMFNLAPGETRMVAVDYLYPPDSTPPQVLTVTTITAQPPQVESSAE